MRTLRDLMAAVLVLLATASAALWLPGMWLQTNIVERPGFLAIAQPLGDDEATQQRLIDSAADSLLGSDLLPAFAQDIVEPLIRNEAVKLTGTPAYQQMWDATMVDLHGDLFAPGASDLTVDLSPAVDAIVAPVEQFLPFGIELPIPDHPTVTLAEIPDIPALQRAQQVLPYASWTGPLALVLAIAAMLLAGRRRLMMLLIGIGTAVAGAVAWGLSSQVEQIVPDTLDQADFIAPLFQAFEAQFTADVSTPAFILLGAGAAVIVTAVLLMLVPAAQEEGDFV